MFGLKARRVVLNILVLTFGAVISAHAQGADVFFGVGTARASSTNQQIDTFGNGTLYPTPEMKGAFGSFGANYMVRPYLGVGAEYSFKFTQSPYAGLNYRPYFYDFNAVYIPTRNSNRIVPELQGGLGGAKLNFYYNSQFCSAFAGCKTSNIFLESSNHFQLHLGGGIRFYVKRGMFVRPQIDGHWVNNFFQFGSNWVPQYTISIGYTFGRE